MENQNYEPCLYEVADNWQARWSLIGEFASKWYGVHFRSRESLLPLVKYEEERLGFKLPPSFQEYIMFYAYANECFPEPHDLRYFSEASTITFKYICDYDEYDIFDTIDIEDLDKEDPPVQSTYLLRKEYYDKCNKQKFSIRKHKNTTGYLSSYIFWSLIHNSIFYRYSGGNLSVPIKNDPKLIPMMNDIFDRKTIIEGKLIYEKQNIIAVVYPAKDNKSPKHTYRLCICIYLWKPLDRIEVPQEIVRFAKNMVKTGGNCSGLFAEILDENSQKENLTNTMISNNDDNEEWDIIPF